MKVESLGLYCDSIFKEKDNNISDSDESFPNQ